MLSAARDLLHEIRRMQCLVCLARPGRTTPEAVPVAEVAEALEISAEECGGLVEALTREGLVQPVLPEAPTPSRLLRLTRSGRACLEGGRREQAPEVVEEGDA